MKKSANGWIGVQKGDPSPILYFSGYACVPADSYEEGDAPLSEKRLVLEGGIKYRCLSFAFIGPKEFMPHSTKRQIDVLDWYHRQGLRIMLDSGAFTVQQAIRKGTLKNVDMKATIDCYARYVLDSQEAGKPFDFYVTFDYVKQAPEVHRVTQVLRKEYGLDPVPVYHGDSSLDWFRRYADEGHRLICIGRVKALGSKGLRHYYEQVFELASKLGGIKLHGLMVTGQNVYRFPWYSVDSATWTRLAANGRLVTVDTRRRRIGHFRVSRVKIPAGYRELIQLNGSSPDLVAECPTERCLYNIREFLKVSSDDSYLKARSRWQPLF